MHFSIVHTIRYTYSKAAFLEPHVLRVQPRSCGYQSLGEFDLEITPLPAGATHCLDAEGNHAANIWFAGEHDQLTVTARSRVQTMRENPFDYLLQGDTSALPMIYDERNAPALAAARQRAAHQEGEDVAEFAEALCRKADSQLLPFLDQLNQAVYAEFECIRREEGDAWPAHDTFRQRRGSCRDLTELYIDACRSLGVAARFVSGYQEGESDQEQRDLHAWAEVYIPGGGWRGYDPTHGLAVSNRHIAVAAAVNPGNAAPVTGSFRGTGVTATIDASIDLRVDEPQKQVQQQQSPNSENAGPGNV